MQASIADIADDFPSFRVAVVVAHGLAIPAERPRALDAALKEIEEAVRRTWDGRQLSEIPAIADWRNAYKAFGVRKTSYRSSVERLIKNILAGRSLPRINPLVDIYNGVSAHYVVPVGADDLARVEGDVGFRYARAGDAFIRLGDETGADDPPKQGEVVYADEAKVLCRRWNWSQHVASALTAATTDAVITVQDLGTSDLAASVEQLNDWIREYCDATVDYIVLDSARSTATLPWPAAC